MPSPKPTAAAAGGTGVPPEQLAIDALEPACRVSPGRVGAIEFGGGATLTMRRAPRSALRRVVLKSGTPRVLRAGPCLRELGRRREAEPLFQEAPLDDRTRTRLHGRAVASEQATSGPSCDGSRKARGRTRSMPSPVNRAVLYGEAGDLDNELACNRRAVEANPQSALAANALASCLGMRGFVDESLAVFARVLAGAGWGDAEELARAQKLHGVVTRMKAQEGARGRARLCFL